MFIYVLLNYLNLKPLVDVWRTHIHKHTHTHKHPHNNNHSISKMHVFSLFGQRPRRGRSPVEHRGNLSVRPYVRPPPTPPSASYPLGPKSKLYGPNPSKMVQIRPKLAKSRQNGLRPGKMGLIWLENLNSGLSSIILAP